MNKRLIFLGFVIILLTWLSFCNASVDVENVSYKDSYVKEDLFEGEVDIFIEGESFNSYITSGDDQKIKLSEFLDDNGADYSCDPYDCSVNYESKESSIDKMVSKSFGEEVLVGFMIEGEDVNIYGINFSMASDFQKSNTRPLYLDFFEKDLWEFNFFSDTFGEYDFGCYDVSSSVEGPLIRNSRYCSIINLSETGSVFAGGLVDNDDNLDLLMSLYPSSGGSSLGECEYNPSLSEDGCVINAEEGDYFPGDSYYVCIEAIEPTDYHLYEETVSEDKCGFVYANGPESSVKNYGIFASTAKYASYTSFDSRDFDFESLALYADEIIEEKYDRNCSEGCFLPIIVGGIDQTFRIYDVEIDYSSKGEDMIEDEVHLLEEISSSVDFSGVLDLSLLNFKVNKEGKFKLYLDGDKFFEEFLELIPAPFIRVISPLSAPAGIPILYYVDVEFNSNKTLEYEWDFDGDILYSVKPYTYYTFDNISNFSVGIKVSSGNLSSEKSFNIQTTSPREYINSSINKSKEGLDNLISRINLLPIWYQDKVESLINLSYYSSELSRIQRELERAIYDEDYLEIALAINELKFPEDVYISEVNSYPLINEKEEIDPSIIKNFDGRGYEGDYESYKDAILRWQNDNIKAIINSELISLKTIDGEVLDLIIVYSLDFTSYSEESEVYFVIDEPFNNIYFKEDIGFRKTGESSIYVIDDNSNTHVEFYVIGGDELTFFASPSLSSLVLSSNVDETCNKNLVCEKEYGENSSNCRTDCKPVGRMILYIILAILFVFVIYTLIQLWYKHRYESYLFGGKTRELYNLMMFIANARARGIDYSKISSDLIKQGWARERVNYAIAKSKGKNVGLPEIIPFSKISAHIRNNRAKNNIATNSRQQYQGNINKYSFQRRI